MLRWSLNVADAAKADVVGALEAERSHHVASLANHTIPERRMPPEDQEKFLKLSGVLIESVAQLLGSSVTTDRVSVSIAGLSNVPDRSDNVVDSLQISIDTLGAVDGAFTMDANLALQDQLRVMQAQRDEMEEELRTLRALKGLLTP